MNLIRSALRRPISILVLVAGLLFFGINAVRTIKIVGGAVRKVDI